MTNNKRLDSWKEISLYLNRTVRTCYRWRNDLGLPVYRLDKRSKHSRVFAYKNELDEWFKKRRIPQEQLGQGEGKAELRRISLLIGNVEVFFVALIEWERKLSARSLFCQIFIHFLYRIEEERNISFGQYDDKRCSAKTLLSPNKSIEQA